MAETSRLLINEPPLQVLPSLARALDINKAIILQQIHYWLQSSEHWIEDHLWIYNSYEEWSTQFPWLSERAVRWHIKHLEEEGYLIAANFNSDPRDNTKWYRLNYGKIDALTNPTRPHAQDEGKPATEPSGGVAKSVRPRGNNRQVACQDTTVVSIIQENTPIENSQRRTLSARDKGFGKVRAIKSSAGLKRQRPDIAARLENNKIPHMK